MNKKLLFGTLALGLIFGSVFGFQAIRKIQSADAAVAGQTQMIDAQGKLMQATQSNIDNGLASVRTFKKSPAVNVTYQNTIWNPYYSADPTGRPESQALNFVDDEGWLYTVAADTNKIIQVGPAPRTSLDQPTPTLDFTARYSKNELQQYAIKWLKDQGANVDEATKGLEFSVTTKDEKGYFFRWTDKNSTDKMRFLQVGFTIGGSLLSYTNSL